MKKYKLIIISCVVLVLAALAGAFFGLNYKGGETTTVTTVQTTTEAQTTQKETTSKKATTQKKETEKKTTAEPVIDLNSLTVIDLYPLSLAGGKWDVKHCQGIAVDKEKGYIYYSYTTMLVKCDFDGNIVGTVTGIKGHLGDIAYNEADGRIYCGYYSENRTGFYAIIFQADKINKMDMKPTADIVRSVYLRDPYNDYKAIVTLGEGDEAKKYQHRYGTSGIDATTFGPDFSGKNKKELLTIAQGIYENAERDDNNYQVLVQYDVTGWWDKYAKPLSSITHTIGPSKYDGKYFLYTGNTKYGVQTMEYFDELNLWILNCYKGSKTQYQNYSLFAIDGDVKPKRQKLKGQPETDKQYVLSLYQDGSYDKKNDIYGWNAKYGTQGIAYMGDGLFYIVRPYLTWTGIKTAICYLCVWAPDKDDPFVLAAGIGNDYSISKKPRIETTAPKTTKSPTTSNKASAKDVLEGIISVFGG
ncbi:MAG: hypothetical protein ACI4GY_07620 [Acutalibacteraceae bacterium]